MRPFYERVAARRYYKHPWAVGSVILRNGQVLWHGKPADATRIMKELGVK